MRHLLIIALAVVMICIAGAVWAKAIYVPQKHSPPPTAFLLLEATPAGFWLNEDGSKLTCEESGC